MTQVVIPRPSMGRGICDFFRHGTTRFLRRSFIASLGTGPLGMTERRLLLFSLMANSESIPKLPIENNGLSDFREFLVTIPDERSVNSRNCLNPKGEFCGCSGASSELSKILCGNESHIFSNSKFIIHRKC